MFPSRLPADHDLAAAPVVMGKATSDGATIAGVSDHHKAVMWTKDRLVRFDDLELALEAAIRVNKHLNGEVEAVIQQLHKVEQERDAWQQRAQQLARQLAKERRHPKAGPLTAVGSNTEQELSQQQQQQQHDADTEEDRVAEFLGQLQATADEQAVAGVVPPAAAFQWQGSVAAAVSALVQKGQSAGWLAQTAEIQLGNCLGQGAFGTTYRATWRGADVAVKCVRISSETEMVNFLREVECLAALRHPHIVPFLGACLQDQHTTWLISEFMSGGTLAEWLHHEGQGHSRPTSNPLIERLERALEVGRALAALEACHPPILHRDVKPSNVFLDAAGQCRLGDFGLARQLPNSRATLTGETGTYLYMSPEMIRHECYDNKTDVWSFGVLLAELISGQIPYQHTYMTPVQVAMGVADEKLQPWLPANVPASLLALAHACFDYNPDMRPPFSLIVPQLMEAIQELKQQQQQQQQQQPAATPGGLFGRLMSNKSIPSSWTSVLGQLGNN
eukprot:jgi/Chrzof1/6650/Cz19g04100.t1